jgi:hypothetical protein
MPKIQGYKTEKEDPILPTLTADQTVFWSSVGLVLCIVVLALLVRHAARDRGLRRSGSPPGSKG